jgi:hypothetical protein
MRYINALRATHNETLALVDETNCERVALLLMAVREWAPNDTAYAAYIGDDGMSRTECQRLLVLSGENSGNAVVAQNPCWFLGRQVTGYSRVFAQTSRASEDVISAFREIAKDSWQTDPNLGVIVGVTLAFFAGVVYGSDLRLRRSQPLNNAKPHAAPVLVSE